MEIEKIKTIIIIAFAVILVGGIISYISFNQGQNSKLKELANNGEFVVNVPLGNDTSVTEIKTFRLQDFFVTIEAYNKLQTDCQSAINQLTRK